VFKFALSGRGRALDQRRILFDHLAEILSAASGLRHHQAKSFARRHLKDGSWSRHLT